MNRHPTVEHAHVRRAVRTVALFNLSYFGVEFAVALAIGSVALFADSIDFFEDAAVNLLIVVALGWTVRWRATVGMGLAGLLLISGLATPWALWHKLDSPAPPDPVRLSLTGAGALAVNLSCALPLARCAWPHAPSARRPTRRSRRRFFA